MRWTFQNFDLLCFSFFSCEFQGMKPPSCRDERFFDVGTKFHVAFDLSYIKFVWKSGRISSVDRFSSDIFSLIYFNFKFSMFCVVQLVTKVLCICVIYTDRSQLERNWSEKLQKNERHFFCFSSRTLLSLGSSKPWEDILEEFAGVRTFSAQACLKYFQPLKEYLEDLVRQGQLNVGWTCSTQTSSSQSIYRFNFLIWIFVVHFFVELFPAM